MKTIISRTAAAFILMFAGAASLFAYDDFDLPSFGAAAVRSAQTGPSVTAASAASREKKEWTVMVFMNAKNDLSGGETALGSASGSDIAEMKKVGSTPLVNVVVEYGEKGKGSRRLLIGRDSETVLASYPDADMGDHERVADFITWAKTAYPARRYMLVLWNHGLGWVDPPSMKKDKGILFDDETDNYVRTVELGEILRRAGYVDILAMNACLMQTAEVAYEVKDNAGLLLASEETMIATGFDYEKTLNFMNASPGFTDEEFGSFMVKWFSDLYSTSVTLGPMTLDLNSQPGTLSAVRPAAMNELPRYLDAFASEVMKNEETDAVKKGVERTVRFSSLLPVLDGGKILAPSVDLYDLASVIGAEARSPATVQAAESLKGFIKSRLVVAGAGLHTDQINGYDYARAGGLAIYMTMKIKPLPEGGDAFLAAYPSLSLSRDSLWDEFVAWSDGVWRE